MPTICRVAGVLIRMYFDDHPPPHFHAIYEGHEAKYLLDGTTRTDGSHLRRIVPFEPGVASWTGAGRVLESSVPLGSPRYDRDRPMSKTDLDLFKIVHVTSVEVLHDHVVRLSFDDGCVGELDLGPKLWGPVFEPIAADYDLFRQVRADHDLGTIAWPNGGDLAPEVLHLEAVADCPDPSGRLNATGPRKRPRGVR